MENKFIYLVPGNWFELKNINTEKIHPYDLDALNEEIINQVNTRADKLSFIDISFGSKYTKCKIEDITMHIDPTKFDRIAKLLTKEKRHPIITFHGTSHEAVQSILDHGYIIPGLEKNTNTGSVRIGVQKKHGSAYGVGIYSSPFFDKANYYTAAKNGFVYVLINMVFLGTLKMVPPGVGSANTTSPTNGSYPDGSNTRIVYGLEQLVSADSNRIVPVGVMKVSVN